MHLLVILGLSDVPIGLIAKAFQEFSSGFPLSIDRDVPGL